MVVVKMVRHRDTNWAKAKSPSLLSSLDLASKGVAPIRRIRCYQHAKAAQRQKREGSRRCPRSNAKPSKAALLIISVTDHKQSP